MFLFSLKSLKGKLTVLIIIVTVIVIVATVILKNSDTTVKEPSSDNYVTTEDDFCDQIADMGLTVDNDSLTVEDVTIPQKFDETYNAYNLLQLRSGFDLSKYKGCTVKKYTYTVTNYPGYEDSQCIKINLLVDSGEIIGGDICSLELDGFMKGLYE